MFNVHDQVSPTPATPCVKRGGLGATGGRRAPGRYDALCVKRGGLGADVTKDLNAPVEPRILRQTYKY